MIKWLHNTSNCLGSKFDYLFPYIIYFRVNETFHFKSFCALKIEKNHLHFPLYPSSQLKEESKLSMAS